MARIKEFVATNTARTDDKGFAAFETLGRRVGGQYDQAGNDIRDAGRATAAAQGMIGRWPFNIIDLQNRAAGITGNGSSSSRNNGRGAAAATGFRLGQARDRNASFGDEQFAPRQMPNLAALNQMSEGAGALGRMLGGGRNSSSQSQDQKDQAQYQKEQMRQMQLDQAAQDKWQQNYDKGLAADQTQMDKDARDYLGKNPPTSNTGDENSPYYNPDINNYGGASSPSSSGDYGSGSTWDSIVSGLGSMFSSSDSAPAATADIPAAASDYNPNY